MKVLIGTLVIITVMVLYFLMTGAEKTVAPTDEGFQGPTEMPYTNGPSESPPQ